MCDKILVTGAKGQLGIELSEILPDAIFLGKEVFDISDKNVIEYIRDEKITTIVNCAAYTAVDNAEDEPELAAKVNFEGASNLAKSGAKIIHISTDYVFDGTNYRPYKTDDKPIPLSVYGQTKLAGEKSVLENADIAVIIRTSWLYSSHGNNFVKTMLKLGQEKKSINVVCEQIGTPTYAKDLAKTIAQILPQLSAENKGIYHYTNEGVCSWYDFACEIMSQANLDCEVMPILSSAYPTKARRPFYSVLDKTKIKETFNIKIPHWKKGLQECLKQF